MKIAFFSESIVDESVLKTLVEEISESDIEETDIRKKLQYRSSSHLDKNLPVVIRSVHYNSDAEFLVICSDSDDFPVHVAQHDTEENKLCRLCGLRNLVKDSLTKLQTVEGKKMLKVAIGVPVPAIEAWLLFGKNPQVSEHSWIRKQNGEKLKYDRQKLKIELYGSDVISLEKKIEISLEAVQRIAEEELFEDLEKAFPQGFGSLSNEVKSWN